MMCMHSTHCIVFASRVLYLTVCDINVLHADLLAIVGGGCAWKGQQQHVDDTNIGLTSTGGDSRPIVVSNLITVAVKEREGGEVSEISKKMDGFGSWKRKR